MMRSGEEVMYDGPRLAAWLRAKGIVPAHLPARLDRAIRRWANGDRAGERLVDDICAHVGWGSHITTIPHDLVVKGLDALESLGEEEDEAA